MSEQVAVARAIDVGFGNVKFTKGHAPETQRPAERPVTSCQIRRQLHPNL
jgi:hypothetical protein